VVTLLEMQADPSIKEQPELGLLGGNGRVFPEDE